MIEAGPSMAVMIGIAVLLAAGFFYLGRATAIAQQSPDQPLAAAHDEAQHSKQRLESFFDHAPIALSITDMDGNVQKANRATAEYYGLKPEEFVGKSFADMVSHWPGSTLSPADLIDRMRAGKKLRITAPFEAAGDMGRIYADMTFFPIRDAAGEVIEIGTFAIDVTEQRGAQAALAEQQANLLAFFDYAPLQVYITDLDHKIVMVNDWVHRETGADVFLPENVIGLSADQMVPSSWAEMSHDNDTTVVDKRGVTQVEVRGQFGGKERDIISIRFPIKDADGQVIRIGGFVVDITAQMDARREAENARAMLQAFSDNVPAGLSIKDRDRNFMMINEFSARSYYVAKPADLIGKNAEDIRTTRHGDHLHAMEQQVLDTGKAQTREVAYEAADGQQRHMHLMFFPILGEDGSVTHIGSLTNDITEQRQDQHELTQSRAMLQAFFDNIPAMTFIISLDRHYVSANSYALNNYGFAFLSPQNLIGQPDITGTPPHWHDIIADAHRTVVEEGKPHVVETSIDLPDGSFKLLVSRFPIRNAEGETTHVGGLIFDRTAERQAEIALAEREATLQAFFDNLPGLAFLSSNDGTIIAANSFMADGFGLPDMRAENLIGKEGKSLLPKAWAEKTEEAIKTNSQDGKSFAFEAELKLPDGLRHVHSVRFPVRNKEGEVTHVGGLVFDRTSEKQASEDLLAARESLHQSEKLAALGQLLAGVSHELNNPLAAVIGQASLLAEDLEGSAHAERVSKIQRAADRCARIVQSFLAMARQKAPEHRSVSLADLVRQATELTEYQMRAANITVDVQLDKALPAIDADPDQLHQVVVNLITNARQALDGVTSDPRITISAKAESGHVKLCVADNGPGIDPVTRARIFDPFYTTKEIGSGTGLGLSYSLGIVEAHGGTLELEPTAKGTTFCMTLPVSKSSGGIIPEKAQAKPQSKGRVLVVDDEADVAETLHDMLVRSGLEVVVALGGKAAQLALGDDAHFDLVISDIRMPEIDGPELYAWIEQNRPELGRSIAFVTGDTMSDRVAEFLAQADCPVLEKPFGRAALDELIKRMMKP